MSAAEHPTPPLSLGEIAALLREIGRDHIPAAMEEVQQDIDAAATTLEGLEARERKLAELFAWLMGESGDFPTSEPGRRYGFRSELARRLESIGFDYARLRAVVGTGTEEEQSAAQEGIRG